MDLETRVISRPLEVRADGGNQYAEGYAAVFFDANNPDATQYRLWGDTFERILPGAFDEALRRPDDVRCLFNHNADLLLGRNIARTLTLSVDSIGLRYSCLLPDDELGKGIAKRIARGDISGCSFSFQADSTTWREVGDQVFRELVSVRLFDVGPVTFPAYSGTDVTIAKRSFAESAKGKKRPRSLADIELNRRVRSVLGTK